MKSKPLKSEKDRLLQQKEKSGIIQKKPEKVIPTVSKESVPKIAAERPKKETILVSETKNEPSLKPEIKDLKIQMNKTEVVKAEKSIEVKALKQVK